MMRSWDFRIPAAIPGTLECCSPAAGLRASVTPWVDEFTIRSTHREHRHGKGYQITWNSTGEGYHLTLLGELFRKLISEPPRFDGGCVIHSPSHRLRIQRHGRDTATLYSDYCQLLSLSFAMLSLDMSIWLCRYWFLIWWWQNHGNWKPRRKPTVIPSFTGSFRLFIVIHYAI